MNHPRAVVLSTRGLRTRARGMTRRDLRSKMSTPFASQSSEKFRITENEFAFLAHVLTGDAKSVRFADNTIAYLVRTNGRLRKHLELASTC
jgi:chromosome condensin MukBEF MukE localization factor